MGFRVIYQKRALNDLSRLICRIAQDDPEIANRFGNALLAETEKLVYSPHRGNRYDTVRNIRSFPFPPYRIYYRVKEVRQTVEILKIWHGARGHTPKL